MQKAVITLQTPLDTLFRPKSDVKAGLARLNIYTVRDLLYHFPSRYVDASDHHTIGGALPDTHTTITGIIKSLKAKKSFKTRIPMTEGTVEDQSGSIRVLWLNQPYLANMLAVGQTITLSGKVTQRAGKKTLINPTTHKEKTFPIDASDTLFASDKTFLTALYPETKGLSSLWIHHAIERILNELDTIPDILPQSLREDLSLPSLRTALVWIHTPKTPRDATIARKRFSFEEIFLINLARARERAAIAQERAYSIDTQSVDIDWFTKRFGFSLTSGQQSAISTILKDLEKDSPMSRLLEGDVGSGKTAVAAVATYATVMNRPNNKSGAKQTFGNLQVAYMAPTEILATQHFESFIEFFKNSGISIALITGSGCKKFPTKVASSRTPWTDISRAQLKKWIANGEIPIVIGTHALIQKSLEFKHLALAIIDEQHRFGMQQRKGLAKKDNHFPHLLSMTATPIPRTLALTLYGDLDLTVLDELPAGRKQVLTELVLPDKRHALYEKIRSELAAGRQAYVICPRIDEPDPDKELAVQAKSVTEEAKRLQKDIFPEYTIDILHSKMTKDKKDIAMRAFAEHKTDILVATSVVEVGVNVPNATVIIIEGAERFGLAQLHQLRGRVQRSSHQAYCYLFAESKSETTLSRMKFFLKAKNGFELAEYDLELRGSGELTGTKQWGISDIGMEALKNPKLVEAARAAARSLIAADPSLAKNPLLSMQLETLIFHSE
jgi:ATP-dependent DNA helicase RecG